MIGLGGTRNVKVTKTYRPILCGKKESCNMTRPYGVKKKEQNRTIEIKGLTIA